MGVHFENDSFKTKSLNYVSMECINSWQESPSGRIMQLIRAILAFINDLSMTDDILENLSWKDSDNICISDFIGDRGKCLEYLKMAIENIEIVEKKKIEMLSKFIEKNFKSFVYATDKKKE